MPFISLYILLTEKAERGFPFLHLGLLSSPFVCPADMVLLVHSAWQRALSTSRLLSHLAS